MPIAKSSALFWPPLLILLPEAGNLTLSKGGAERWPHPLSLTAFPPPVAEFGTHSLPPTGPGHCHLMCDLSQNLLQVFASTIVHRGPLRNSGLPRHSPALSLHLQKRQCQHVRMADKTLLRPCHSYSPFPLTQYCRHTARLSSRVLNNPSLRLSSA